jgi:hypothetical protein
MLYVELAIIVALILINGLLALAELAVVSSRRARLQALVDRDVIGSRRALALASDPGRFLSTVQVGITLVGVLSGAFSGRPQWTGGSRFRQRESRGGTTPILRPRLRLPPKGTSRFNLPYIALAPVCRLWA